MFLAYAYLLGFFGGMSALHRGEYLKGNQGESLWNEVWKFVES